MFVSGADGLGFKSRTGQIGHRVANDSPLQSSISSNGAMLPAGAMTRRWAPQTRYALRRNTASTMKDFIRFIHKFYWSDTSSFLFG